MSVRATPSLRVTLAAAAVLAFSVGVADAKSTAQKECAEKYQAAKAANTLNGMTYNQFRKQCAAEAREEKAGVPAATPTAAPAPVPAPALTPAAAPVAPPPLAAPATASAPRPVPATAAAPARPPVAPAAATTAGSPVYPPAVSTAYSSEKPGKARMKTCLDQYHSNQANNGNGGMKWIQKGGGYYSECNKRLKG